MMSSPPSTSWTARDEQWIQDLIQSRQAGHSLPGLFYTDEKVFRADMERIWRRGWLFAGHSCQISQPGDYFTYQIGTDSILIVRDDGDGLRAMHNTCRHRGTRICDADAGHVGRFVCPYHQWTYERNGRLASCRGMHDGVDKDRMSLRAVRSYELEGFVFICLGDEPPDLDAATKQLSPLAAPQGFGQAKIARIMDYCVRANWKLVWENNRECYHCNVNHPQYIKANFDHYNADDTSDKIQAQIDDAVRRSETKWASAGLDVTHKQSGMTVFPDAENNIWYSANRTPLAPGYVSETMDGTQVAPLMGHYTEPDVGTLRMRTVPNCWCHASCDHAVSTRLTPAGPNETHIRVLWLVDQDAVEGRDYQLEELMPFWQLTSEQDWQLCERAQQGVQSSHYTPGPYSTFKEYNVDNFVRWYLQQLSRRGGR